MMTMILPIPLEREVDWSAAAHAIREVRLAVLWDCGETYNWEKWLEETENLPGAIPAFTALRTAQSELHEFACLFRGGIEHGWPEEPIELTTPTHRVWVMGGPSWGEDPDELVWPAIALAEAGVIDAAGFKGYTRYDEKPIPSRTLGFSADGLRVTRFGVAAAHAAEQAAGMEHPPAGSSGRAGFAAWQQELDGAEDSEETGRALLRHIARGLALSAWLKDPYAPLERDRLDDRALELCLIADDRGLGYLPRRRSWRAALGEQRRLVGKLGERFEQLDDPPAHDDAEARSFIRRAGGTLDDGLEAEIASAALLAAVAAISDLCGDVGQLIDVPPRPIAAELSDGSEMRGYELRRDLSVIVVGEIAWDAAERVVEALPLKGREERRVDLSELRRLIAAKDYRRFATEGEAVGAHRLYIAAQEPGIPLDIASGIGRLGRDGVLDAAGVVCWSAPDGLKS